MKYTINDFKNNNYDYGCEFLAYAMNLLDEFEISRSSIYETLWSDLEKDNKIEFNSGTTSTSTEGKENRSRLVMPDTRTKVKAVVTTILKAYFRGNTFHFGLDPINYKKEEKPEIEDEINRYLDEVKKLISDYTKKIHLQEKLIKTLPSFILFGNCIFKHNIDSEMETKSQVVVGEKIKCKKEKEKISDVENISIWNYYCDNMVENHEDSIAEVMVKMYRPEQIMSMSKYLKLDKDLVRYAISLYKENSSKYAKDEQRMGSENTAGRDKDERISLAEFWGSVPVSKVKDLKGITIPVGYDDDDMIEEKAYILGEKVLVYLELNVSGKRPFLFAQYSPTTSGLYDIGLGGENKPYQDMMSTLARLFFDNKVRAAYAAYECDYSNINWAKTKRPDMKPGKIYYKKPGVVGSVLTAIQTPDVSNGLINDTNMIRQWSREDTSINKYLTGGEQKPRETVRGMNEMLARGDQLLMLPIKSFDDNIIEKIIESFYWVVVDKNSKELLKKYPNASKLSYEIRALGSDYISERMEKISNLMALADLMVKYPDAKYIAAMEKILKEIGLKMEVGDFIKSYKEIEIAKKEDEDKQIRIIQSQAEGNIAQKRMVDYDKIYESEHTDDFERSIILETSGLVGSPMKKRKAMDTLEAAYSLDEKLGKQDRLIDIMQQISVSAMNGGR